MKRFKYAVTYLTTALFLMLGMSISQAQTYKAVQTWGFESGSVGSWAFAGAYQSGTAPTGGVVTPTGFSAHGGTQVVQAIKGSGCWQINFQLDGSSTIQSGDSLVFWVYPTVSDTTHTSIYQVFWQDNNWANWNAATIPDNMVKANQWNKIGILASSITAPLNRIGMQTVPKATHADSTAIDTIYIDDITVYRPVDTTLVSQWGKTSLGTAWPLIPDTTAGNASLGNGAVPTTWATISGQFDTLTATMDTAVVVTGQMKITGTNSDNAYTWLRYALTFQDSATLNYAGTDSAMWTSPHKWYGYEFDPISGAGTMANGTGGAGTVWEINNGNWTSTYSNGGPPLSQVMNEPYQVKAPAGTYNFAFSVKSVNDTVNELRWYLIEQNNKYWFGGTIMTASPTKKFNSINFGFNNDFGGTQVDFSNVHAKLGMPITVPAAPWAAYYVQQWGLTPQGSYWPITNDSSTIIGNGTIKGSAAINGAGWATIQGGFGQALHVPGHPADSALIVKGQVKFTGATGAGSSYTPLRYAIAYLDSSTLNNALTDSAMWAGKNGYSGYEFDPISGAGTMANGGGGAGTAWTLKNGNWNSTYSNNGAPVATIAQQPYQAQLVPGTYNFAFSIGQVNDTTNEVRWYLIEQNNKYWFGGTVMVPATTNKFNAVCFGLNGGDFTQFDVMNTQVDYGKPITVPQQPWQNYYVSIGNWGFYGNQMGGWNFIPGQQDGNAGMSGSSAVTGWAALRGDFGGSVSARNDKDSALVVTGDLQFVGGGFQSPGSFRFGLFQSDSAGTVMMISDTVNGVVYDSTHWTGTNRANHGYLITPSSTPVDWYGTTPGTWGGIPNGVWYNTASGYILGNEMPSAGSAIGKAGNYSFAISIAPAGKGVNDVRYMLVNTDTHDTLQGGAMDNHSPLAASSVNGIEFALAPGNTTTGLMVTNVQVTLGTPPNTITGIEKNAKGTLPTEYSLSQNYPNPFNPTTTINYALPKGSNVSLVVYDILGRVVANLVDKNQQAGYHTVNFNAVNLASGVYFYRLKAGNFVKVKKLMLLK